MNVLWIAGWYPNQTEPYSGDFVQRHAQAASLYHTITVLFITRDAGGIATRDIRVENTIQGTLNERKIYYYSRLASIPLVGKIFSYLKYESLLKKELKKYFAENGKPDLIHFYIGMRAGAIGTWVRKLKVPYVVSEQWTGFLPEGQPHFNTLPSLFKTGWRSLIHNASGIHAVSAPLENAIRQLTNTNLKIALIPNVVNTAIFFPVNKSSDNVLKLVHITSLLDYQKNTKDILLALALLKQRSILFHLDVFGLVKPEYRDLVATLGISNEVLFHNEKSQEELASYFSQADSLIIYSRFETFGCVIIEALACGTPVIASDIAVLHENIENGRDGLFAKAEDPQALAERLAWLATNRSVFKRDEIAKGCAAKYNYQTVGKMFADWYKEVLAK